MMTLGTAEQVTLFIFLFFVAIFAMVTVSLLAGLVYGINKLNAKVDSTIEDLKPLIAKSNDVLDTVQQVTETVGARADSILKEGEEVTASVARKVDRAASVVEKTVTSPLIQISSIFAGLSSGLHAFNRASRKRR
jgi:uncharacterized protein YoxC